jgi:transposase
MSIREQQRARILTKLLVGEVTTSEAGALLGLSERQVWRLKARLVRDGPAGLVQGNRGQPTARRIPDAVRARVVALARTTYDGANDSHLAELLTEEQGLTLSRQSVQRILHAATTAGGGLVSVCFAAHVPHVPHAVRFEGGGHYVNSHVDITHRIERAGDPPRELRRMIDAALAQVGAGPSDADARRHLAYWRKQLP